MSTLTERQEARAVEGAEHLCQALGALAVLRDELQESLPGRRSEPRQERLLLGVSRACNHLTEAAADLPNEVWGYMADAAMTHAGNSRETVERILAQVAG